MSTTQVYEDIDKHTQRALNTGIATWAFNIFGALLGMIPLALPISIALTVVTFFSGIAAMLMGIRAKKRAEARHDELSTRYARIAFWLGTSHLIIIALIGVVVWIAYKMGAFG